MLIFNTLEYMSNLLINWVKSSKIIELCSSSKQLLFIRIFLSQRMVLILWRNSFFLFNLNMLTSPRKRWRIPNFHIIDVVFVSSCRWYIVALEIFLIFFTLIIFWELIHSLPKLFIDIMRNLQRYSNHLFLFFSWALKFENLLNFKC